MSYIIYTDGSCRGNGTKNSSGGFGVVITKDDELIATYRKDCETTTTNNREELKAILKHHNVKHFKIATLFLKPEAYKKDIKLDYVGIRIPNKFIVGYGLDYDGLGRNLKDVYQLSE